MGHHIPSKKSNLLENIFDCNFLLFLVVFLFRSELVIAYGNLTTNPRVRSPIENPLIEQLPFKQRVQGSSPCAPTNLFKRLGGSF